MGPAGEARIIQVHPTRRCNLSCLHCYSSSGPRQAESLPAELLTAALADAVGEGYTVLAVSGGEPLLYPGLHDVLAAARDLGMRTGLVTNGMLLNRARLTAIVDLVDAIALSLDGVPSSHNRMRDNPRAFDGMAANLAHLRASGLPFAFVFTLTEHNVDELGWVARFAYDQGATSLQVHPLTSAGHARQSLPGCVPDATELGFARYEVQRVQAEYDGRLSVQIDIASTAALAD